MLVSGQQLKGHLSLICLLSVVLLTFNQPTTVVGQDVPTVCYGVFGCFSWTKYVFFLPDPVEKIGATFYVQTDPNVTTRNLTINYHTSDNYDLFDNTTSVAFVIHGWLDDGSEYIYSHMFAPLLKTYDKVISVDWSQGASGTLYPKNVANCQLAGREIGYLLSLLNKERGLDLSKVHLIGFSLGAHIAGIAGRWTQQEYDLTVGRITGLDAAGPLIEGTKMHIQKTDAAYVDAIHSSAGSLATVIIGRLGSKSPYGHKDFYPNGGTDQPHCPFIPWVDMQCRHYAAVTYFTHSLDRCDYHATRCNSWKDYKSNDCSIEIALNARMGLYSNQVDGEGSFYLNTDSEFPYC